MELSKIDKNFEIVTTIEKENICWLDSKTTDAFSIFGLMIENGNFIRLPAEVAKNVSNSVSVLAPATAGGRICFETDSSYIALSMKGDLSVYSHMTNVAHFGFDLHVDEGDGLKYIRSFIPPTDKERDYDSIVDFKTAKKRKILIHFPLYTAVDELYIGLENTAQLNKYSPYKDILPIVYYGSSITQGGCASKPGNAYQAIVAQKIPVDFINLGFSGGAHGEQAIADYIADLPMSCFVLDYDHNDCGNPDLKARHSNFYHTVRDKHPDIPIIIMSSPYAEQLKNVLISSREMVYSTYKEAKENGDNVYFIDGFELFGEFSDCATVDGCHPNDFGFVKMAEAVINTLKKINL